MRIVIGFPRDLARMIQIIYERTAIMATQDDVNALTERIDTLTGNLSTSLQGIQGDLDALVAANPGIDVSALAASVEGLAAVVGQAGVIDAENPAPPVEG